MPDAQAVLPCLNEEKTTGICIEKAEKVFFKIKKSSKCKTKNQRLKKIKKLKLIKIPNHIFESEKKSEFFAKMSRNLFLNRKVICFYNLNHIYL